MKLDGRSSSEIAERLEVKRRTVYLWFGDQLVKAELARQLSNVNQHFSERLAEAGLSAVRVLQELAVAELATPVDPATKLKAAQELLRHAEGQEGPADDGRGALRADLYLNPPEGSLAAKILTMTPKQLNALDDHVAKEVAAGNLPASMIKRQPELAAPRAPRSSRSPD